MHAHIDPSVMWWWFICLSSSLVPTSLSSHTRLFIHHTSFCFTTSLWLAHSLYGLISPSLSLLPSVNPVSPNSSTSPLLSNYHPITPPPWCSLRQIYVSGSFRLNEAGFTAIVTHFNPENCWGKSAAITHQTLLSTLWYFQRVKSCIHDNANGFPMNLESTGVKCQNLLGTPYLVHLAPRTLWHLHVRIPLC